MDQENGHEKMLSLEIDGEALTNLIREWFWGDVVPYEQCEQLLSLLFRVSDVSEEMRGDLIHDIIEGRQMLAGSAEMTVISDETNVEQLALNLKEKRIENVLTEIRQDMEANFIKYVDVYSAIKTPSMAADEAEHLNFGQPVVDYDDCKTYFWHEESDFDPETGEVLESATPTPAAETPTMGGLWLINHPELIYRATNGDLRRVSDRDDFWGRIHDLIEDDPAFDDPAFRERNESYEVDVKRRVQHRKHLELLRKRPDEQKPRFRLTEMRRQNIATARKLLARAKEGTYESRTLRAAVDALSDLSREDELLYHLKPDDIDNWDGLISPYGDFYSCNIGEHGKRAYNLIRMRPDFLPDRDVEAELRAKTITEETALEDLLRQGWCATRFLPTVGHFYSVPADAGSDRRLKKAQVDRIWDAALKHNVVIDTTDLQE